MYFVLPHFFLFVLLFLLNFLLQTVVPPKETMTFTEDTLLRHAQFICDRVLSLDNCAGIEDTLLITAPCMRSLMKLSGVTLGKKSAVRLLRRAPKVKMPAWSMATTTKLVNNMFENIFAGQLAKNNNNNNNKVYVIMYYN